MEFEIVIDKLDGEISSYLTKRKKPYHFEIQNIIGDFIDIRHSTVSEGKKEIWYDYENHCFTSDLDFYTIEYECKKLGETFEGCKTSFKFLKQAIPLLNNVRMTLDTKLLKLTELQQYYGLQCHVNISLNDNPRFYQRVNEYNTIKKYDTHFEYTCKNVGDMVAAIIHYYVCNGYKLTRCKHCKKYYATQSLKQQYCRRISPYKNSNSQKASRENNCETTVRWELQHLKELRNNIDNSMRNSLKYQLGDTKLCFSFRDKSNAFVNTLKTNPTPKNFEKYSTYLYSVKRKGEWKS